MHVHKDHAARIPGLIAGLRRCTSPGAVSRSTALTWMESTAAITHLVSSLEYLVRPSDRRPGGLHYWGIGRRNFHVRSLERALDMVAQPPVTTALHAGRCAIALALLAPTSRKVRLAADATLSATSVTLHPRHHYGTDAPDQVAFLVQTVSAVARAAERRPQVIDACLWYVAMQCVLSYTVSGSAKLPCRAWRSGDALVGVTRTLTFGDPAAWRLLQRNPRLARILSAGVLAMECSFPMVFLGRGRMAPPMLLAATSFHLAIARIMGLGRFVSAFLSMHPAVLYAAGPRERRDGRGRVVARRDDTLPRVCGGLVGSGLGFALLAEGQRRTVVLAGRGDEQTIVTSAGNTLALRRLGPAAESPLIVLEGGLLSTAEHWEWIARALKQRFSTVTYSRAGYGPSRHAGGAFRLESAVRDLAELVERVADGRPVVLVGHSLGGYLALRAAVQLGQRVVGVGLLESSHPGELQRSARQAQGQEVLTSSLALMPLSLRAGLGVLLRRPDWVDAMPEEVRALAGAQYRDPRLWASGQREWQATVREFAAFDGRPPLIDAPLLVMTAALTACNDPVQKELHDELADQAPWAERHVIAGADHETVLTHAEPARRVADLVAEFVERAVTHGSRFPEEDRNAQPAPSAPLARG